MFFADPFRHWILPNWCQPVSYACLPDLDSPIWEASYDNDLERGKKTTRRVDLLHGDEIENVINAMRQSANEWRTPTGINDLEDDPELWGGGLHVMMPGGWLQTHLDYDRHIRQPSKRRAMNLIAFLNPEWRESWGGALTFCEPSGEVAKRIYPRPGTLVAFETNDLSYHGVEPVSWGCPVPRVTAAVYFLAAAGPHNTRTRAMFVPNRR